MKASDIEQLVSIGRPTLSPDATHAEMLIFPGEDHELTRSGSPRHRAERFDAVVDWWRRLL